MEKLIEWNSSLSVDINVIDEQHKVLIDIINQLYRALKEGKARFELNKILKEVTDYTVYHFQFEENYFDKFDYTDKESHRKKHQVFINDLNGLKERFSKGDVVVSFEVMNLLRNWLESHIKVTDKQYVQTFKNNGII